MRRLLPHPLMSGVLLLVWLLLMNSVSPGQLMLGAVLGLLIPLLTRSFWPDQPRLHRPGLLLRFIVVLLIDIVVANLSVARLILAPRPRLRPAFVRLPLDLKNEFAITVLASTITLTPGTVSAELEDDRRHLVLHCLDVDSPHVLIKHIKSRYEAPLREIFEPC